MFNSNDILARLQNGESADTIAAEMAKVLNDANKAYEDEKASKNAEVQERKMKIADLQDILDAIHDFILNYYCDGKDDIDALEEAMKEITAEDVLDSIENIGEMVVKMGDLTKDFEDMFGELFGEKKHECKCGKDGCKGKNITINPDKIIDDFIKSIGL